MMVGFLLIEEMWVVVDVVIYVIEWFCKVLCVGYCFFVVV